MYNRDEVIRQSAIAVRNHARGVGEALSVVLGCPRNDAGARPGEATALQALRDALVALASGFEPTAGDGSTRQARQAAAVAALEAWDGPEPKFFVQVGDVRIPTSDARLVHALGYETPMSDDSSRTCRPNSGFARARSAEIAQALSEGVRGEAVLFRALALALAADAHNSAAHAAKQIEDTKLHVARVERQTAILRAKAAGVGDGAIKDIVSGRE